MICTKDVMGNFSKSGICPSPNPNNNVTWLPGNKICYVANPPIGPKTCMERNFGGADEAGVTGGWHFDDGIQAQLSDASQGLINLLNCLRPKFNEFERQLSREGSPPVVIGRISSISDSDYIGNLGACHVQNNKPANCDHLWNSCHYGGDVNDGKSYAVDFGDEENFQYFERAISQCARYVGYHALENSNHYHISTASCRDQ
ncbi:MAG: hypothetical protein Q8P32_03730 [Candidatus Komeilibacteria bacterium]|nr:hypothetical protein [Candidatus Komeilibacteria bacterium]